MDLVEARARGFDGGTRHPWEWARLALAERLIARNLTLHTGDTVLDVGCGDTFVAEGLARVHGGVRFYAVDPAFTDDLIERVQGQLAVPNVSLFRSIDAAALEGPASLILLMDVIEHVPDDVAFLRELCQRPCFGKDTRLFITVPSYAWLFSSHDRFLGHYRRYSRRSLQSLLDAAQLTPADSGHLFGSVLPVRVLQVLRERILRSSPHVSTGLATWNRGERTTRAMTTLLTLEGQLAVWLARSGIRLPGLSHYVVCRKSA